MLKFGKGAEPSHKQTKKSLEDMLVSYAKVSVTTARVYAANYFNLLGWGQLNLGSSDVGEAVWRILQITKHEDGDPIPFKQFNVSPTM